MAFPQPEQVSTNGVELEVFRAGDASNPAIVLCHGWPEHAYSWRHQLQPLADAGYHVIAPNQRGYGRSSRPEAVEAYAIEQLTGDLLGLLDHYGYETATFIGHDWGAIIVWAMAVMHPERAVRIANLSVPFMQRGTTEWVGFWESMLGGDFYIVHFNRQPGVADAAFDAAPEALLRNLYRTRAWEAEPVDLGPGMPFINMTKPGVTMPGELMMSEAELGVFVDAFKNSGFTGGLNYYRNFTRNWHTLGAYEERVEQPALMIYGSYDMVPKAENLAAIAPKVEEHEVPCGHWIQQEQPEATNRLLLDWLARTRS